MRFRRSVLIAVAAGTVALGVTTPASADAARIPATVDLPCGENKVLQQSSDWYLPTGPSKGLVWVQHGFARSADNVAALAESLAAAGYLVFTPSLPFMNLSGCTLQNLGDNTPFLDQVANLFATASDPAGPLARSLAQAARRAGHSAPELPQDLVFIGHSVGAEAVEYVAHRLHATAPAAWSHLHGAILLDPVVSFLGHNTAEALADLDHTTLPVLAVSGPPSPCNNFGSGTNALLADLHRPFLGVRLTHGVHTDAEGSSSDELGELLCGTPQEVNVSAIQRLTVGWTDDFFQGGHTASLYADEDSVPHNTVTAVPDAQPLHAK